MGVYDFFVAEITCPRCNTRFPADDSTNIQTKLKDAPLYILQRWVCPACHRLVWADVAVRDGVVAAITGVDLNRETLARANYIDSDCIDIAHELTGRPFEELLHEDIVQILRERL